MTVWSAPQDALEDQVKNQFTAALDAYRADPKLLIEHFRQEESFRTGGYSSRQIFELIQNAADAVLKGDGQGKIEVILIDGILYCANQGRPFNDSGVDTVTHAYLSSKRDDEIGRFGLGFKSILSLSDHPQIFSRSVSFEFNSETARENLEELRQDPGGEVPRFRVPTLVDAEAAFAEDRVLAELANWASTIIKIPIEYEDSTIIEQLEEFDTEFLLFAEAVNQVEISIHYFDEEKMEVDPQYWIHSRLEASVPGRCVLRYPDGSEVEWLRDHQLVGVDESYRRELGDSRYRDAVTITYAAPINASLATGRFWSYFPLQDKTSVSGILNAPWSVNDDRTSILHHSKFNRMLLAKFAPMIVRNLKHFATVDDPARHLDYLPSRAREVDNPADMELSVKIPILARSAGIIPDLDGTFRQAKDLETLAFEIKMSPENRSIWAGSDEVARNSPHPKCFAGRTRPARLLDLVTSEDSGGRPHFDIKQVGIASWLTQLGQSANYEYTLQALKVLVSSTTHNVRDQALMAPIVPLSDGRWARVNESSTVLLPAGSQPMDELGSKDGFRTVDSEFVAMIGVREVLAKLGFKTIDDSRIFEVLLNLAAENPDGEGSAEKWSRAWVQAESVPLSALRTIMRSALDGGKDLRLKNCAGAWSKPEQLYNADRLGFEYLPAESRLDPNPVYAQVSQMAGVIDDVVDDFDVQHEDLFEDYINSVAIDYRTEKNLARFIDRGDLEVPTHRVPGPLDVLRQLDANGETQALVSWSEKLLKSRVDVKWTFDSKHRDGQVVFSAPHVWAVKNWGRLNTTWGRQPVRGTVSPVMVEFADFLPVARSNDARSLGLAEDPEQVSDEIWRNFLSRDSRAEVNSRNMAVITQFDILASKRLSATGTGSGTIVATEGGQFRSIDAQLVYVASTEQERKMVEASGHPFLYVPDKDGAAYFKDVLGARAASEAFSISVIMEDQAEAVTLLEMFSGARGTQRPQVLNAPIIACGSITRKQSTPEGTTNRQEQTYFADGVLYILDSFEGRDLLKFFADVHRIAEPSSWCEKVLSRTAMNETNEMVERVKSCTDDVDRIRLLFAPSVLRKNLPKGLLEALERSEVDVSDENLAEIYFQSSGYRALEDRKGELTSIGLNVPATWAGSRNAIAFVTELGFDKAFAGESTVRPPDSEVVLGRPELKPLHDYQVDAELELRRVLRRGSTAEGESKVMIELPTGSGKTRVAVESAVKSFLDDLDPLHGPVLWIAQSEELCEQAVQTWSEIWRANADNRPLTISRLWSTYEIVEPNTELSVVVATDAKLELALHKPEYKWLLEPTAVFIDEAHRAADSPRYGSILKSLGLDRGKHARPLIGLSATPFKGTNEPANRSLAVRFGKNLVKSLGDDPIRELQRRQILAQVRRDSLEGETVVLTGISEGGKSRMMTIRKDDLENLGENVDRNLRIVDHIESLDPEWPVIVFTPSVASAHVVAALLTSRGIEAKAVSGQTPKNERSRVVENFRRRKIRVLTNCDVFTHGFDAPMVRAIYVARPTLSPGVYMQMVGRGLRGLKNGGSAECLIVDVEDTVDNPAYHLAYRDFEDAWSNEPLAEQGEPADVG